VSANTPIADQLSSIKDTCEKTWPSDQPTRIDDTYRQHRCGLNMDHRGRCMCRYCGTGAR
jgi:hypothetical protein